VVQNYVVSAPNETGSTPFRELLMQDTMTENTPFDYQATPEQTNEYLRLTLAFLGKHALPPNPVNFALAYEYLLGRNAALMQAMDEALSTELLNHDAANRLFQQYIVDMNCLQLDSIRKEMRRLIMETLSEISQASQNAEHSASALNASSSRLNQNTPVDELYQIVGEVINETQNMAQNSQHLRQMLEETRQEIDTLRDELEQTRQQATTDPLTGLLNRRGFESALQLACNQASQHKQALSLLVIDIDHFKNVNDTHGHLAGDKVLRNVGTILSANIKGKDIVCRFGGEEFAILLTDTGLQNGIRVAEILRLNIERSRLKLGDGQQSPEQVTISIGVTEYVYGESTEDFIKRSDDALYQSKRAGRNRVSQTLPPQH